MRNRPKSTVPPAAVGPPAVDPRKWEDYPAFRETFLHHFTEPEYNEALRRFGTLLVDMLLEFTRFMPDEPEGVTRHELRAAAADLRYLQGFLRMVGEEQEVFDLDDQPEQLRLCQLAARLSLRVEQLAAKLEKAVER